MADGRVCPPDPMTTPDAKALLHRLQTDFGQLRVLLVDRHASARDMLRQMLAGLGISQIHGAGSASEVLKQVKANRFDIIFSDYMLEDGRDGQQLLEELRVLHLVSQSTVFIIVTSERSLRNVVSVAELTPDDYLVKPFTADNLLARLARALYRKQALGRAWQLFESGAYLNALAACEDILQNNADLTNEAFRLKGDVLRAVGRFAEAEQLYREILMARTLPWARVGLAEALAGQARLAEAIAIVQGVVREHPRFIAAHDTLARLFEAAGQLPEAQATLAAATEVSPHNTSRQRRVGDIATRNGDLGVAEQAYQTALRRVRGSSLVSVGDYSNLARVLLDQGKVGQARAIALDLRREQRNDPMGELAASITESLCYRREGEDAKAREALDRALAVRQQLIGDDGAVPEKISVDLADACFANGRAGEAQDLLRAVAYEHALDGALRGQIQQVFERAGMGPLGEVMLDEIARAVGGAQAEQEAAAQSGDAAATLAALFRAADRVPNVQFLVNAANAVFTMLDAQGWRVDQAEHGLRYLLKAQAKDAKNPRVVAAYDLFQHVAHKYGVSVSAFRQQVLDSRAP